MLYDLNLVKIMHIYEEAIMAVWVYVNDDNMMLQKTQTYLGQHNLKQLTSV